MIFRDEDGILYQLHIPIEDEEAFLTAQKSGKIKYIKVEPDELPEWGKDNRKIQTIFYKQTDGTIIIDEDRTIKQWQDDKLKEIERYIYSYYPQSKQNSDLADKLYYENTLKARGFENLEQTIVTKIIAFESGKNFDELLSDIADENKEAILQLVKVGIRVAWVQKCKAELKTALLENREPEYPVYPLEDG